MTEKPGLRDFVKWVKAYPNVDGHLAKVIWWAVLKKYFFWPVVLFFASGVFWLTMPQLVHDVARWLRLLTKAPDRARENTPKFEFDFDALQKKETQREERAIKLAKNARTLVAGQTFLGKLPDPEVLTNDFQIRVQMDKMKGNIHIIGWQARRIDDDTYVVNYTYERGPDKSEGWPFEVNLPNEVVRYVIGDAELEKKYGWSKTQ